jgi:iron uptake system component EfeO
VPAEPAEPAGPDGIPSPPLPPPAAGPRLRLRLRSGRRRQIASAAAVLAGAVTATLLATGSGGGSHGGGAETTAPADGLRHTAVEVSTGGCGRGWTAPRPGLQVFDLHNTSDGAAEVYLDDPRTGKIYGEVDGLAPGTARPLTVDLGSGAYAFMCLQNDADAVTGPTVVVPGSRPRGPAAAPVDQHDLIPPTLEYQKWVGGRIAELAAGTGRLKADIDRGDLAAARRDWLTAHLVYARMGAAYDTFGDADGRIDGIAARTPGAVRDPGFTGFHRIEYGLWHGGSAASLEAPAAALDTAVRALRDGWPQQRMDPAAMGLRAHEIIEDTERFELTARTDYGSGTNLATARANLDGTEAILAKLRTLLVPRDPGVDALDAALARAGSDLDAQHRGGVWTPVDRLTRAQRERIDADFGALLEQLAPVAAIFEVRRTA